MSLSESIIAYLDELAQVRRQSPHTVSNYRRDLRVLSDLMAGLPGQNTAAQLETLQIRRLSLNCMAVGWAGEAWRACFLLGVAISVGLYCVAR